MIEEMEWYSLQTVELFPKLTQIGDLIPLNIYPTFKEQQFENQQKNPKRSDYSLSWAHLVHQFIIFTNMLTPLISIWKMFIYINVFCNVWFPIIGVTF